MPDSIRERIVQEVENQAKMISTANGYNTNYGNCVYRAKGQTPEEELPVLSILDGEEQAKQQYGALVINMEIALEVLASANGQDISPMANQVLVDLIQCIVVEGGDFGGLVDNAEYLSGSISYPEGTSEVFAVAAVFTFTYSIVINDPYSQPS